MNEQIYDAVVIGSGPAGAACGIMMKKLGKTPLLIDKAVFPRHKTCAGLVTGKTYQLIDALFDGEVPEDLFCHTTDQVGLYQKTELLVKAPLTHAARFVSRSHYDNALVKRYKSIGGVIREGERSYTVDEENHQVTLSDGSTVRYRYLIYADGVLSQSRRSLDIDKDNYAFGVEAYIPSSKFHTDSFNIYFDTIEDGYTWAFPHGDTVCIGAANPYSKSFDYKKMLKGFLMDIGVSDSDIKYYGAFLPYGYYVPQDRLSKDVMLLGDAGGFADPVSGEGLYMSLKTGILAAQALMTDEPKEAYLLSVKPLKQIVDEGRKLRKLFYSDKVHRLFLKKVRDNEPFVTFFFENQVEEYRYSYRNMVRLYLDYKNSKK